MLDNLSAVAANYVEAGFTTLVLDGVLETADDRRQHAEAVAVPLTVCRLVADLDVVHRRLRGRHVDDHDGLEWHLHRSGGWPPSRTSRRSRTCASTSARSRRG